MKSRIPDGSTPRVAERRSRSGVILLMTMVIPLTAAMCWSKDSNFFEPEPLDATLLPDLDAPIYGQIRPIQGVGVLNSNVLSFTLNDPAGTNGAVPSGIDPPTVSARLANGTAIPLSANGVNYTGSFSTIPDGALTVSLSAKDKAGNTGTGSLSFSLDRTAPNVALTTTPATTATSEADSVRYTVGGTVADPHLSTARLLVTQPGTDAACGTADDVAWPQGSSGGQVSQNTFDLTADVVASGQFSRTFTTYNGVAPGGASRIAVYCGLLEAFDTG